MARRVSRLPIKLEPCSNGEYVPPPATAVVREAIRRAEEACDDNARRLGMSRRRFLASTCGAATTLLALAACAKEANQASGSTTSGPGGTFAIPPDATTETSVADAAVGGTEPIVDVQTHLLEFDPAHPPASDSFGSGFPQGSCGEDEWWQCFSVDHWMEKIFLESDTTMAVISAVPIVDDPDPLSIEVMEGARRVAEQLCGDGRVLLQGHTVPNVGRLGAALDAMAALVADHPIAAWKVYTHYGEGFRLDEDGIGGSFLAKVEELGVPIVSVHKGFSGGDRFAAPADIGPAAVAHPGLNFVVYHSGFEPGGASEGAYDPDGGGVDRLVRTLSDAGVDPGANVYAELGSTWRTVMGSPDEAAHVLGKLLVAVGPDNVLWGTDSIWYGSPQDQIQAFRTFEITAEFQERFGYPALTAEIKAKILGTNAARLYQVDPAAAPCRFSRDELASIREERAMVPATEGPVSAGEVAATFGRDHPWF